MDNGNGMSAFELGYKYGTIENDAVTPRRAEQWLRANNLTDSAENVIAFCEGHGDGMRADSWRLKNA